MRFLILFIFILIPLIEIAIFIAVGDVIGVWATIGLVIITALIGTSLLRHQGLSALNKAQKAIGAGRLPMSSVIDGVALLLAGAFLLTPGLLTDSLGFLLFIPAFRTALARFLIKRAMKSGVMKNARFQANFEQASTKQGSKPPFGDFGEQPGANNPGKGAKGPVREGPVIEGDYKPLDRDNSLDPDHKTAQGPSHNDNVPGNGKPDPNSPWRSK